MKKEMMTVGEVAAMMGVTVRTLQYYDKEGLLKPSRLSGGGRRLYSAKDVVKLHQILSFKYLGFSLEEIKHRLLPLDTPQEMAEVLERQEKVLQQQINELQKVVQSMEALRREVLAIQQVDFQRYAEIIECLRKENREYWVWKLFEDPLADHVRKRYGNDPAKGEEILGTYRKVLDAAVVLKRQGTPPGSPEALELAKSWWDMVLEFTGGDLSLLPSLEAFNAQKDQWNQDFAEKQKEIDEYLGAMLGCYFEKNGSVYFEEGQK